jgi:putative ABC transport system ATP-binding protein
METQLVNQNQVIVKPVVENRLIELRRVTKAYEVAGGKFLALEEVDMQVDAGEFVAMIGKSGSGKSTLRNMLSGDFAVLQLNNNNV